MCSIGVDVAQGGPDNTTLAPRHDGWYAPIDKIPGVETPGGTDVAGRVVAKRRHGATVVVDLGGGWGGECYAHLKQSGVDNAIGYMGVKPTGARTRDNLLRFYNVRTQALWQFREALDPDQDGGSSIALPPSKTLLADLCAPRFEMVRIKEGMGIKAESKEDVIARLGRSTDEGDAVIMAWYAGAKAITHAGMWAGGVGGHEMGGRSKTPQVNFGPRRPGGMARR